MNQTCAADNTVEPIISGLTVDIEEIKTACKLLNIDPEITYVEAAAFDIFFLHWSEPLNVSISRQMESDHDDCIDYYNPLCGWCALSTQMIPAESGRLVSLRYILCTK